MHQMEAEGNRNAARVNLLGLRKDRMIGAILLGTTLTQNFYHRHWSPA